LDQRSIGRNDQFGYSKISDHSFLWFFPDSQALPSLVGNRRTADRSSSIAAQDADRSSIRAESAPCNQSTYTGCDRADAWAMYIRYAVRWTIIVTIREEPKKEESVARGLVGRRGSIDRSHWSHWFYAMPFWKAIVPYELPAFPPSYNAVSYILSLSLSLSCFLIFPHSLFHTHTLSLSLSFSLIYFPRFFINVFFLSLTEI